MLMNTDTTTGIIIDLARYGDEVYALMEGDVGDHGWGGTEIYFGTVSRPLSTVFLTNVQLGDKVLVQMGDGETLDVLGDVADEWHAYITAVQEL